MRQFLVGLSALLILIGAVSHSEAAGAKKIRIVIIDGQNNHNWKATTPIMKKALEQCGLFTVDVATSPPVPSLAKPNAPKNKGDEKAVAKYKEALAKYEQAKPKFDVEQKIAQAEFAKWTIDFDKYDVVVSNYNGQSWPAAINTALDDRLKVGKIGLVIVHAANNAFGGWKEYNQMIGMGWRGNKAGDRLTLDDQGKPVREKAGSGIGAGHGPQHAFTIIIRDPDHLITKGMPLAWMHATDELYQGMRGPIENVHLLATAYADKGKNGSGMHEPMIWTISYGKGRVFHTPMGHDVNSMLCVGFQATLQRGTEWAATGAVTLPLPSNFPTAKKVSVVPAK